MSDGHTPADAGSRGGGRFLQRFALRTQFFPFTAGYRILYWAAIRLCRRRLGGLPGVVCVYLRRGMASGRPVYGLSDIDLLVMVDSENRKRDAARVRNRYESLRRAIPMLGDGELAVYHPEEFRELYAHSPFYRQRFDAGRREWRRLWGRDVFDYLPPEDAGAGEERFELLSSWRYLSRELLPDDGQPAYLRRYIAYKMTADAAKAWLAVSGRGNHGGRDAALKRAAEAKPEVRDALTEVARWRGDLLSSRELPVDAVLEAFTRLAREAFGRPAEDGAVPKALRVRAVDEDDIGRLLGSGARRRIEEACAALDGIDRAILMPRLDFHALAAVGLEPGRFAGATVDAFDLIVTGKRLPRAGRLREFNRRLKPLGARVNGHFCDGALALALHPAPGWTVRDPQTAPELFACIAQTAGGSGLATAGTIRVARAYGGAEALEHRARALRGLFREPEVFQMGAADFFLVFWETLRATYVCLQPGDGAAEVPATSRQVAEALAVATPGEKDVLETILSEYEAERRGEASELARYTVWAAAYVRKLAAMAGESGGGEVRLPEPPMTQLAVTVAIATRNRAAMLGRAMESLAVQTRRPDEVVIIDNASTDGTEAMARSFTGRLNVRYFREETVGIPYARNAALREATGDVIAFIDDDCEAEPDWLAEIEKPFLKDPHVGSVGGNLSAIEGLTGLVARFHGARMETGPAGEGERAG